MAVMSKMLCSYKFTYLAVVNNHRLRHLVHKPYALTDYTPFGNDLTRFNKIATQGTPQMAVDKEANSLSRVYSYYSKFNLCLFYV